MSSEKPISSTEANTSASGLFHLGEQPLLLLLGDLLLQHPASGIRQAISWARGSSLSQGRGSTEYSAASRSVE